MHLTPHGPNYLFVDDGFETPFGAIGVNREAALKLSTRFDFIHETAADAVSDNTIELQMPLLRRCFPDSRLVAAGVPAEAGAAEQRIEPEAVAGEPQRQHAQPDGADGRPLAARRPFACVSPRRTTSRRASMPVIRRRRTFSHSGATGVSARPAT